MDDTLFIPAVDLAAQVPINAEDRLYRLRKLFVKHGRDIDLSSTEGELPKARITFRYCPVCGFVEWACSAGVAAGEVAGLTLINWMEDNRFSGRDGCNNCEEAHSRAPEVVRWVSGVARTHGFLIHRLPTIDKVS